MNPLDLLGGVSAVVTKILDFIPDPTAKAKAMELANSEALDFAKAQMIAQASVNEAEAKSVDPFTSRARPFILWVGGASIAYTYILSPFLTMGCALWAPTFHPPILDSGTLMGLVTTMLGLGGMHVYETTKGTK